MPLDEPKLKLPDSDEGMLALLSTLSDEELQEMFEAQAALEKRLREQGPQNPEELHEWLKHELDIDIPRVAVCEGHSAPFDFLSDLYFEETEAALGVANRGGAKTFLVAVLHWLNSRFKPGCESATFGATEAQSLRAYAHLKHWIYDEKGNRRPEIASSLMRETLFANGSRVEVLPGTPQAVNGPHPQKAHADEIELMDDGTWKESQPLDTPIATPQGWKKMGDLRVGDFVLGRDGKPTRVTKIKDYGEQDVYRVTLTDGRSTECCLDHLWTVAGTSQRHRGIWKVVRTSEMIESGLKLTGSYRYAIPQAQPVDFGPEWSGPSKIEYRPRPTKKPEGEVIEMSRSVWAASHVHPYVMGVLLGDGYFGDNTTFRSADSEIVERVEGLLPSGYIVNANESGEHPDYLICRQGSLPAFKHFIDDLGLAGTTSHTKFIPDEYKIASRQKRIELLRGLFDTDGCAIEGQSVVQYATVSEQLAKDVREVVSSLGGRAIIRSKGYVTSWANGTIYTLDVSFGDETMPFALSRKSEKLTRRKRTLDPSIKSIEFSRKTLTRCIGVDNADSTYLTTDYIVTHNSRNMTVSGKTKDGRVITPQDIATSTRKGPVGRVQKLIDEIEKSVREGYKPPRKLYIWCIKETAAQVKNCQVANPKLGPEERCNCDSIRKGEWEDGRPRLLRDVCNGDFNRSRGWQPYGDIVKQFTENDRETFEVQQLCAKPEMRFHYVPTWRDEKHCIRKFEPDPANGPIFTSVDWGGTNPHAVNWYQLLAFEIEVGTWVQPEAGEFLTKRIPEGSLVCFDEIYIADIGNDRLGDMVIAKEQEYRRKWPEFRIYERYADPQGRAARTDWKEKGLRTSWRATREFEEHIKLVREIFDDELFYVDGEKCKMFVREVKEWRADPRTNNQVDEFNHAMSNFRYALANIRKVRKRAMVGHTQVPSAKPIPRQARITRTGSGEGPIRYKGSGDEYERWRKSLGAPVTRATRR